MYYIKRKIKLTKKYWKTASSLKSKNHKAIAELWRCTYPLIKKLVVFITMHRHCAILLCTEECSWTRRIPWRECRSTSTADYTNKRKENCHYNISIFCNHCIHKTNWWKIQWYVHRIHTPLIRSWNTAGPGWKLHALSWLSFSLNVWPHPLFLQIWGSFIPTFFFAGAELLFCTGGTVAVFPGFEFNSLACEPEGEKRVFCLVVTKATKDGETMGHLSFKLIFTQRDIALWITWWYSSWSKFCVFHYISLKRLKPNPHHM